MNSTFQSQEKEIELKYREIQTSGRGFSMLLGSNLNNSSNENIISDGECTHTVDELKKIAANTRKKNNNNHLLKRTAPRHGGSKMKDVKGPDIPSTLVKEGR